MIDIPFPLENVTQIRWEPKNKKQNKTKKKPKQKTNKETNKIVMFGP